MKSKASAKDISGVEITAVNHKLVNPIPQTCEYLRKYLNSKALYLRETQRDYSQIFRSRYGRNEDYRESEVVQFFRNLCGIKEEFGCVGIPEEFATPELLLELIRNVREHLIKQKKAILEDVIKHYKKTKIKLPSSIHEAESISDELIAALNRALDIARNELDGNKAVSRKRKTKVNKDNLLSEKQKTEINKQGYLCNDKIIFTNITGGKRSYIVKINNNEITFAYAELGLILCMALELKKNNGGWVARQTFFVHKNISDKTSYIDRLVSDIRIKIKSCLKKKNPYELIQNDGEGNWRLSLHPDFVTHQEPHNKNWLFEKYNEILDAVKRKREKYEDVEYNAETFDQQRNRLQNTKNNELMKTRLG